MNAYHILIYRSKSHMSRLGLALVTAIRVIVSEIPAFRAHHIGDLLQILSSPARDNFTDTVMGSESVPASVKYS